MDFSRVSFPSVGGARRWGALAGLIGLALVAGCRAPQPPPPPPPTVTVAPVEERPMAEWEEFSGRVQAVDSVVIRPRVSGYVRRVAFEEGRDVAQGEVLFQIDARPYRADLAAGPGRAGPGP